MFVKSRLLNICIRHKCFHVKTKHLNHDSSYCKVIEKRKNVKVLRYRKNCLTSENNVLNNRSGSNESFNIKDVKSNKLLLDAIENDKFIPFQSIKNISHSTVTNAKVIQSNTREDANKISIMTENSTAGSPKCDKISDDELRVNDINIQMLSKSLYKQLFLESDKSKSCTRETIESIKNNLKNYDIDIEKASRIPNVNIELPSLEGKDIEEHFYNIAKAQILPYEKVLHELLNPIPEMPENWLLQEGWTRYTENSTEKVDFPLEEGLVFDVEISVKFGPVPIMATAVSAKAWYGWVSRFLIDECKDPFKNHNLKTDVLIPMESIRGDGKKLTEFQKKPKIIVGHNVSFDRSKIVEQYWLKPTGTRFVDTMSMHICVSGVSSFQRATLMASKKKGTEIEENWKLKSSLNNLVDVHKLYCSDSNKSIDKLSRNIFIEEELNEIRKKFNELMIYCASDVIATHEVLCNLLPIFKERFPHPVTLAGMLELGMAYLPINSNWSRYTDDAESTFEDINYEVKASLSKRANAVCRLLHNDKYKEDLWMWDQDWSIQEIKMKTKLSKKEKEIAMLESQKEKEKKGPSDYVTYLTDEEDEVDPLEEKFAYLKDTKYLLYAKERHMPGYPAWYRKLCPKMGSDDWAPGPQYISTSLKVVPKLLNLTWENYPLHYIKEHGWGILVPFNDSPNVETKLPLKQFLMKCPLPQLQNNVANTEYTMSKLKKDIEEDLMRQEFWRLKDKNGKHHGYGKIYKGNAVWCNVIIDNCFYFFKLPHKDGPKYNVGNPLARDFLNKFSENGLAASDKTAQTVLKLERTLSYWRNNKDRIISQLGIWLDDICLPSIVKKNNMLFGAIIPIVVVSGTLTRRAVEPTWMTASNAQEDRIGSELRAMKIHGATPFGWMTLDGTKANATDMHSVTAKAIGISRDHAKVINYARIYGAGQKFAEQLLKQFNPSMTSAEARSKSKMMLSLTKGNKMYTMNSEYSNESTPPNKFYTNSEAYQLSKAFKKPFTELFSKSEWVGGSESAMFNRLEQIANNENPVTPFLSSRLSRALEDNTNDSHLPTKINWVVQSGAVDFLHLMLVSMRWLMRDNARFCLSFHDEIRYLVPSRYKYNAALAMHVTNLMVRSFCASKLDMKDLPMSVAFFSSVEVDTVLRKDANDDCKTPSNPHGLEAGYGIPFGESLNIWQTLEKSKGSLGWWNDRIKKKKQINKEEKNE
ncbi:DNA polymerase subunit gamma-1, mitochondrial isoform X2 [Prorops nasuta]|uniref:DNA polymerase subunit gamma-1, mitochondrial isoform X2 n=1 Tax=Prorops nasuta TaxID=863751 RepID=UPI0034CD34BC